MKMETRISIGIIILLTLLLGWIYFQQYKYDVNLYRGKISFNNPVYDLNQVPSDNIVGGTPFVSASLFAYDSTQIQPMSAVESFDKNTLSDKIDGKAELYLPNGFISMKCQRFMSIKNSSDWFEVYEYNMGNPQNCFVVLSQQRRVGGKTVNIGENGYIAENVLCFSYKNAYYEFIASRNNKALIELMLNMSMKIAPKSSSQWDSNSLLSVLPSDKRLDDTVKLIPENAFSYSEFNDVILVSYLIGNDTVNCFILDGKDAVTAANKVKGYREFMLELGGEPVTYSTNVSDIQGVNLIGDFEAVFSIQRYVVGVHAARTKVATEKAIMHQYQYIKDHLNGK